MSFQPPDNPKNQNVKIEKRNWRYYNFTHFHHKWLSYDEWFLRYGVGQTEFFVILERFLSFYPPMDPEKKNFEKKKKTPGDIIILHKSSINDNHMVYGCWDMKRDLQNFLSFWTDFCPFTPLTTQKIKILKNWKENLKILSFCTCLP